MLASSDRHAAWSHWNVAQDPPVTRDLNIALVGSKSRWLAQHIVRGTAGALERIRAMEAERSILPPDKGIDVWNVLENPTYYRI